MSDTPPGDDLGELFLVRNVGAFIPQYDEEGEVHVFDVQQGDFVPASVASNSGTGPYQP